LVRHREGGFRIYKDASNNSQPNNVMSAQGNLQDPNLQIAMLQKLHNQTKIFALLVYKGEIKGIRYFDFAKRNFIDIAPWQIQFFNISGMQINGVRELELYKVDNDKHNRTLVIEFLTQHEINNLYRPNRMTSNDLAKALSYIMAYVNDVEYENLIQELKSN